MAQQQQAAVQPEFDRDETLLATYNLSKQFGGVAALDRVTISIGRGITGLVGANGAGKTTLMSILLGLYPPTWGSVSAFGLDPSQHRTKVSHRAAFVPERNVLPDELRAVDYVEHLARVKGLPKHAARTSASDALFLVGIGGERMRPLGTMSTGQRQRVKLAQAIASSPDLVLLDEPTAGLDPSQRYATLELISSIAKNMGTSFLISSHLLDEIEQVCQTVVALDSGRLIAAGPIDQILDRRRPEYRIEFAEALDNPQLQAVCNRIRYAIKGVETQAIPHGVDPTIIVRPPDGTDADTVARACRDAVALEQRRLRSYGPQRATLRDLFSSLAGHQR